MSAIGIAKVDGLESALLVALGLVTAVAVNVRGFIAHRKNKARDAKIETASVTAISATNIAEDAKRGRRLSPAQMEAIVAKLEGTDVRGVRLSISFIAAATSTYST